MKKIKTAKYLIPAIILYIVIVVIYYNSYCSVVEIIESEYNATSELVEESIYNETRYTEIMNQIVDKDLNRRMEGYFDELIDKYNKDTDILDWDLKEIKEKFEDTDIYIIDSNFEVVNSTIEDEIGLTFEKYPDFLSALKKRINGTEFVSDKINFSFLDRELRKYGYMPTPDHQYLLEFSIDVRDVFPEIEVLNIFNIAENLKEKYPFVHDIGVYQYSLDKNSSPKLVTLENEKVGLSKKENLYIKQAVETNEVQERTDKDNENNLWTYKYIPYNGDHTNRGARLWGGSYVIEVVYKDEIKMEHISHQRSVFIRNIMLITTLYFTSSFLIAYIIQKNKKLAYKDDLTKLVKRKRFEEILETRKKIANRKKNKIAILFFDLDKFKEINDTLGHSVGDEVLIEVANRIKSEIRKQDVASRLGGDELIALVSDLETEKDIKEVAIRMSNVFKDILNINDKELSIRASIGISIYPDDGITSEELIEKADQAMYKSKENKTPYEIYGKDNI